MCDKKYSAIFLKLEKKVCLFFFFKSIKVCYEFLHASKIIFLRQDIYLVIFNFIPFKICFIAKKLFLCSKKKTFDLDRFRLSLFVNFMKYMYYFKRYFLTFCFIYIYSVTLLKISLLEEKIVNVFVK